MVIEAIRKELLSDEFIIYEAAHEFLQGLVGGLVEEAVQQINILEENQSAPVAGNKAVEQELPDEEQVDFSPSDNEMAAEPETDLVAPVPP